MPDSPHFRSSGALRGSDASADGGSHQAENLTPALSEIETAIRVAAAKGDASPFDSVRLRNMRRLAGDDSPNVWTKNN